jgi:hypothetical protein
MEELTLEELITKLELQETTFQVDLETTRNKLHELRKEEKQKNLPKISENDFDKLLSIVEQCIMDNRIETGSNVDIYYSINDTEIEADITLTSYFTGEVLSDIRTAIHEGDILAIIEDGN